MGAPMVMVMMVIVVTSGHRTKKNGAHHTFNGCKWRTMGVSCRQEDLANNHEEGEKEDQGSFGDRQPMRLLKCEENCSIQAGFGWESHVKKFICFWLPNATQQLFKIGHQGNPRTFDKPNDDHDKPPIVVMVVGMVDPNSNLADSDHLLHGYENKLYRQEADTLVEDVQGTVEGQVPDCCGQKHTGVVAEVVNGGFSKEQVGQDVAAKAVEHGTDPGGKGTLAGQLHSSFLVLEV